jgi:hypothetical protein
VVARHRRSEIESLASGTSASADEYWPEAVGYGQVWAATLEGNSFGEWQEWRDYGPPPVMHPDHPSAPVPRVEFPADHPSGPMPAAYLPGPPEMPQRRPGGSGRAWSPPPQAPDPYYGNGDGNRWLHAVPDGAAAADYPPTMAPPSDGRAERFQRQFGAGWQETTYYRHETGPIDLDPRLAAGGFAGGAPSGDSLWIAGQVLTRADGQAAQIAQEAEARAAAIRQAAEREAAAIAQQAAQRADAMTEHAAQRAEAITDQAAQRADAITQQATDQAAAIREAAEREAAELRARLDSMTGELGRVATYISENLAAPAMPMVAPPLVAPPMPATRPARPAIAPQMPAGAPTMPDTRPDTRPTRPDTRPGRPDGRPDTRPGTRPARPDTRPTGPRPAPAEKPQKRTRQQQAMRVATYATATMFLFAAITGAAEVAIHGFKFFTFREGGVGQTAGSETDQNFLAKEAAAAHHVAPKGRHHKKTVDAHKH